MKPLFSILITGAFIIALTTCAFAGVPHMINYQGKLTDANGNLIPGTVTKSMTFTIYDDSIGGNILWIDTLSVQLTHGVFSVLLGEEKPIPNPVFNGGVRYLGVKVGTDPEMSPRKKIGSVAHAFRSEWADTTLNTDMVDGYHYSSTWPTTLGNIRTACSNDFHNIGGTDDDVPDNDAEVPDSISINNGRLYAPSGSGNVGIGTTNPTYKLHVIGSAALRNQNNQSGLAVVPGGDVVIGETNYHLLGYVLDVAGNTYLRQNLVVCDTLKIDGPIKFSYDSQWFSLDQGMETTLQHGLSGDETKYIVLLYGKNSYGVHQMNYGTVYCRINLIDRWFGCAWYKLNNSTITVRRASDDNNDLLIPVEKQWDQIRVRILKNQ